MRGSPSARTSSTRPRGAGAARRSRSAGVLGALSVAVMAAALGTLVLTDVDSAAATPAEAAVAGGQPVGRNAVLGADRADRPQRSSTVPPTSATPKATDAVPTTAAVPPTPASGTTPETTPAPAAAKPDVPARPAPKPAPKPSSHPEPKPAPAPAAEPVAPQPAAAPAKIAAGSGRTIQAYLTGYTWHDTPGGGSPENSHPQVHQTAGGSGTYDDPITLAVGSAESDGRSILDWPAGTRFYVPALSRYLIVEDTCGGGAPGKGACHSGSPSSASTWLDIWVDGRDAGPSQSGACARTITGVTAVIVDPAAVLPVDAGPIAAGGGCAV